MRPPRLSLDTLQRLRPILPWLAGGALLVLAALAWQALEERDERTARALEQQIQDRVEDRLHAWERRLRPRLDGMIAEASRREGPAPATLEARWRDEAGWFDALYVWSLPDGPPGPDTRVQLSFPRAMPPMPDAGAIRCADELLRSPSTPFVPSAPGTLSDHPECPRPDDRAWASLQAARALLDDDQPADALAWLRAHPADDPELRIQQDLQEADVLDALGRPDEATGLRRRTAFTLSELDAPQLERTLFLFPALLSRLSTAGVDTSILRRRQQIAEQRLAAWREIQQAARRPLEGAASVGARFSWDQFSETPYLLYSRMAAEGRPGVALLLRQEALLDDFMESIPGFRDELSVVDITGRVVLGAADPAINGPTVPFADTLRHLQVRLSREGLTRRLRPARGSRIPLALVVLSCILLGFFALWAQAAANTRHRLLLQRQRDFTARITHELKTPLAGIRVMAENLSIGAFKSDHQRQEWADRIVDEADRLTARVNEILALSASRELPTDQEFDVEEPLLDLVEQWAPRYDQAGIRFLADLAPVDPLLGDPIAIRDAVACLLDNALKYRRDDIDSAVWLNVRQDGRTCEIEVVDNGMGVPRDQREAIFERFVRVEGPNRGKAGGHGLGLGQVSEIVKRHKGTVRCETGVDGGSRFVMRLPVAGGGGAR